MYLPSKDRPSYWCEIEEFVLFQFPYVIDRYSEPADIRLLTLPTLLEGEALAIWLELSERQRRDYGAAKEKILEAMMPMGFVSLEEFHGRKLRPNEPLSVE